MRLKLHPSTSPHSFTRNHDAADESDCEAADLLTAAQSDIYLWPASPDQQWFLSRLGGGAGSYPLEEARRRA
jgi:hypothetical protein